MAQSNMPRTYISSSLAVQQANLQLTKSILFYCTLPPRAMHPVVEMPLAMLRAEMAL